MYNRFIIWNLWKSYLFFIVYIHFVMNSCLFVFFLLTAWSLFSKCCAFGWSIYLFPWIYNSFAEIVSLCFSGSSDSVLAICLSLRFEETTLSKVDGTNKKHCLFKAFRGQKKKEKKKKSTAEWICRQKMGETLYFRKTKSRLLVVFL